MSEQNEHSIKCELNNFKQTLNKSIDDEIMGMIKVHTKENEAKYIPQKRI